MNPSGEARSFYQRRSGSQFVSTRATVGPWSPTLQHGGPPIALLARALAQVPGSPGLRIARLSIEFMGPVPLGEMRTEAELIRPGQKIELLTGTAHVGGRPVLRATAWRLLAEPGRSPAIHTEEPPPPLPPEQPQVFFGEGQTFPYGEALEWRFVEGGYDRLGPATVWARCRIPLVEDERPSAVDRLLVMLDSANGVSAELDYRRWTFVPVDLTVVLHRHPVGEWVGMAAHTTVGPDGIGVTHTRVFDLQGFFGRSLHTLYVSPR